LNGLFASWVKEAVVAPLAPLNEFLNDYQQLSENNEEQLKQFVLGLKRQEITNILYLPPNEHNGIDYIVRLDKISWIPRNELRKIFESLASAHTQRFISLSDWGYYLLITKLTSHFCRVPEEAERPKT